MVSDSTTWLTVEAHRRLTAELHERRTTRRDEIHWETAYTRDSGLLPRDDQDQNEARIRRLRDLLDHARTGPPESEEGEVVPGMIVTVELVSNGRTRTVLLGSLEETAYSPVDVVTPLSSMGHALTGAKLGEEVTWMLPTGREVIARINQVEPWDGTGVI